MLNPIAFTEKVVSDFLKYQITTYPFADPDSYAQMRRLLNLEQTRNTPLMKGPYISLSRAFREGAMMSDLVNKGVLHPLLSNLAPHPRVYGHQETAIRAIMQGRHALISTGTGSGKTECFLYPIISKCLQLRDKNAPEGIVSVIVYPMNALAEDQLERLRDLLAGTGVSFGMYIGKTKERAADVAGHRLHQGASRAEYRAALEERAKKGETYAVFPAEERVSREEMRTPDKQPRILLTNVKQLELLLTRGQDVDLFDKARLDFLVFDEAHTFRGANGAETACLIRRLRTFCGKNPDETVCVATSATIVDPERGPEAGRDFAVRFFGVKRDSVELVGEEYEAEMWAKELIMPPMLTGNHAELLKSTLNAIEVSEQDDAAIRDAIRRLTGDTVAPGTWKEHLFQQFAKNEFVYQLVDVLKRPMLLADVVEKLSERLKRDISEEEALSWLALGAASLHDGYPFLRPVVHVFVRGVGGAVVTFPEDESGPHLWLSGEDAAAEDKDLFRLPIMSCTTCGQHYFTHEVTDFRFIGKTPEGGEAVEERAFWEPLTQKRGGTRVVLFDRLISSDEDDDGEVERPLDVPRNSSPVYLCRHCGTLHPDLLDRCDKCGREKTFVRLFAIRQKEYEDRTPRFIAMPTCVSCQANGKWRPGGYREPARPIRAVAVSDVHVLAQNIIHRAERRRLLVFADNRQDAAFQAGWMQDHARRFRLRALMYERIQQGAISVGDLTAYLDDLLEADEGLSRALIPEVWRVYPRESEGVRHSEERRYFLRIQILREITTGGKQRIGLEPWGRMRLVYAGLVPELDFITTWANRLGHTPDVMRDGIASILDVIRRGMILYDRQGEIFTHFWQDGDREIQRGYLPALRGVPKGVTLRRVGDDDKGRIDQWISERGDTRVRQYARRWGVSGDDMVTFLEDLWNLLRSELGLIVQVPLKGARGNPLPHCRNAHQVDADKLRLEPHRGLYRCTTCRRVHTRPTPNMACLGWRCNGTTEYEQENTDDYDLIVLDQGFAMLRAREHSAQVPFKERELLERIFKGDSDTVNTLVCTPTLELGVDIGSLDTTLMRNVPPLPANYWQRAGRAGRRFRMAVNMTYARPASHDRSYFSDPLRLLDGVIYPPRFNLRNSLMVEKHVHAAALTTLFQMAKAVDGLTETNRQEVADVLRSCFPPQIKTYLFTDQGHLRPATLDVSSLTDLVTKHKPALVRQISKIFEQGWPPEDTIVVTEELTSQYLLSMGQRLQEVITRLERRLKWTLDQMERLEGIRRQRGTLDPDEDAFRARCDRYIKRMKGVVTRRRSEAEGFDEINTYSVLASEGYLPGYGLDVGAIIGSAHVPRGVYGVSDFDLPRPTTVALREFSPGTLIYANGNIFIPRFYRLEPTEAIQFQVDLANEAVAESQSPTDQLAGSRLSVLNGVPICDVDMPHQSHITDEDDYRFQPAVAVYGYEQGRHSGGRAYSWGNRAATLRYGVHLRLVNVGCISSGQGEVILGYPVCRVCGQSRSPFASQVDRDQFAADHQERCHQPVTPIGFYANVVADTFVIQNCQNKEEAYSVGEALRMGASEILDMEIEDLQILVVGRPGDTAVDLLLYDPMPGGSGLLDQMVLNWEKVVEAGQDIVNNCPSVCSTACIDCLLRFRNAYFHRHLNRKTADAILHSNGPILAFTHDIPQYLADSTLESQPMTVNDAETILKIKLQQAGFPIPERKKLNLSGVGKSTTPDFFYDDPDGKRMGICIYLDGLSEHIHGNSRTQRDDRIIREELRNTGYDVFEIPTGHLHDLDAITRHFYRLGRIMLGRDKADRLRSDTKWFDSSDGAR